MAKAWMRWRPMPLLAAIMALGFSGCATIEGVPARFVPPELLGEKRADKENIDLLRLRQDPPEVFVLGARDVLGIYIEGVLGSADEAPPVHFPEDATLPPAIGFPIPIREDGTVALPLVPPIHIAGKSLGEAEELIRQAYTVDQKILAPGKDRIIVTLIRPRSYQVLVIRGDSAAPLQSTMAGDTGTRTTAGRLVDLRVYENDVLHALTLTGGLPGFEAKNEVTILRGAWKSAEDRDALIARLAREQQDPCECGRRKPDFEDNAEVVRIPLRVSPGEIVSFSQDDIKLYTGDVLLIEPRERDIFYTGGVLGGRQIPLPRDYDLDVLGAIALAGGQIGPQQAGGRGGMGGFGGGTNGMAIFGAFPPTEVIILRQIPDCNAEQVAIKIDLNRALRSRRERILIQPEDMIILRYTILERIGNAVLSLIRFDFVFGRLQGLN